MALRRNDARRRRLVIDPTAQLGDVDVEVVDASSAPPRRKKALLPEVRTYSYGADRRNQLKTTDLIPKRVIAYLAVVLALLTGLWLINFTSDHANQWAGSIGQAGLDALAIRGQGSLAGWFSSFLLIMTGLASLQIYALRQHRCDDYRGTYRLWLWMAGLMVLASINCVANLGSVATNLIQSMASDSIVPRAWLPLAIQLTALSLVLGRVIYEVRTSRGAFALVVFVWLAFCAAAVLQMPAVRESMAGLGCETIIGNCVLFGTTALFLAHLTYARYIFLDAHGLIVQRVKKENVAQRKDSAELKATRKKKAAAAKKARSAKTKTTATANAPVEAAETAGAKSPIANQPRKTRKSNSVKSSSVKSSSVKSGSVKRKSSAKTTSSAEPQTASKQSSQQNKTPSEVLRELAAASRAKEQTNHQSYAQEPVSYDDEDDGVIQMSKAQRRKQRKLEKQRRRAA